MQHAPLNEAEEAQLNYDRRFVPAVLEACFPGQQLQGNSDDLAIFQQVLDGGPYTESPVEELVALGTMLGDLLGKELDMTWTSFRDEQGEWLAMRYRETSLMIFPRDMIIKRVEQKAEVDFGGLYNGVVTTVREMIASGEYS